MMVDWRLLGSVVVVFQQLNVMAKNLLPVPVSTSPYARTLDHTTAPITTLTTQPTATSAQKTFSRPTLVPVPYHGIDGDNGENDKHGFMGLRTREDIHFAPPDDRKCP